MVKYLMSFTLILVPLSGKIKNIVWDAGSTIMNVSHLAIAQELGLRHILSMFRDFGTPQAMRKAMFKILEDYQGKQQAADNGLYTRDDYNVPLPHFMSDTWLCSRISNDEILKEIDKAISHSKLKGELSTRQRHLLRKMLRTALCAQVLGKHTVCPRQALDIIATLANEGYQQYILSNFERDAFKVAYQNAHNHELFTYIPPKNIVISGSCKMIKPHPSIYYYFLERYGLDPDECLLIDDRPENLQAARACGMHVLLIKNGNYRKLLKKIEKLLNS